MKAVGRLFGAGVTAALVAGCGGGGGSAWIVIQSMDLPLTVETSGALKAVETSPAILPAIPDVWSFKIAGMAPESRPIHKGEPVLVLDTTEQARNLERAVSEKDQGAKQIAKKGLDLRDQLLDLDRQLDEARARLRKTREKVEVPKELQSRVELEKCRLDLELAEAEVRSLEEQRNLQQTLASAETQILSGRQQRASQRVADLERGLREMTVLAPRDGLVLYSPDGRGEKRKIGDSVTRWDQVLEVVDLGRLGAEATVAEMEVARLQVGQKVILRLEADPERELPARVLSLDPIVRRQGWDNPRKVAFLRLALDRTDPERMRPGMQFRGEILVGRVVHTLAIPMDAVTLGPAGPLAYRASGFGQRPDPVPLKLGQRSGSFVQVLEGLKEGDRVLRRSVFGEVPESGEAAP